MASRNVTIAEALATTKLIPKRVQKKLDGIRNFLLRERAFSDPLAEDEGGSRAFVARQRQSVLGLVDDLVKVRTSVLSKSLSTDLTIEGVTRTVQGWIIWRREAVPIINQLHGLLDSARSSAQLQANKGGGRRVTEDEASGERSDIIVNFDQVQLQKDIEHLELVLSTLDAHLSRINATTELTVPDGPFTID